LITTVEAVSSRHCKSASNQIKKVLVLIVIAVEAILSGDCKSASTQIFLSVLSCLITTKTEPNQELISVPPLFQIPLIFFTSLNMIPENAVMLFHMNSGGSLFSDIEWLTEEDAHTKEEIDECINKAIAELDDMILTDGEKDLLMQQYFVAMGRGGYSSLPYEHAKTHLNHTHGKPSANK
jgi:hypothetical protein